MPLNQPKQVALQSLAPTDVAHVYSGKAGKCCCGCSGKHSYALAHRAEAGEQRGYPIADDEINDREVTRVLRLIQAHDANLDPRGNFVSARVGKRVYVAYLTNGMEVV